MPLRATVTPLSLYMIDDSVFDGLRLPTPPVNPTDYPDLYIQGFQLDRETLIDTILFNTGELDCIYPDPAFFKYAVTSWSKKELPVWQELYNTLFYKYNPLWNKDGTIKETARDLTSRDTSATRSRTGTSDQTATDTISETDTHNLTDQRTANLTTTQSDTTVDNDTTTTDKTINGQESKDGDIHTVASGSTTNTGTVSDSGTSSSATTHGGSVQTTGTSSSENKVSAYNESAYQNRDKTDNTNSSTESDTRTENVQGSSGNTRTDNLSETRADDTQVDEATVITTTSTEHMKLDEDYSRNYDSERRETGTDTMAHTGTLGRTGTNRRVSEGSEEESEESTGSEEGILDHSMTRTEQGNIGVTMTTQLIQAQRELVQLNFYDLIADRFKERFCMLVY